MMKTNRRWLQSAIKAASSEQVMLPWAAKRARIDAPKTAQVIQLITAAAPKKMAIAAA